jgi:hypothetical protein
VLRAGALCRLASTGLFYEWNGSAWVAFSGFGTTGAIKADGTVAFTADQSMASHKLTNLTNGATGTQDAASVAQVEALIAATVSGIGDWKQSVRAATTANITLSGAQTIDGVSVIAGDRVLVKNQSTGSQNGIYVAAAGAWSRATDADASAEVTSGLTVVVEEGTVAANKIYLLTTTNPITLGSTTLTFTQLSTVPADGTSIEISGGSYRRAALTGHVTAAAGSNSTTIAAGVIVDSMVAVAAAIAGSKISPDFVAQNVVSTGYFGGKDTVAVGGAGDSATFRAGDANGASGAVTGGSLTVRAGNAGTSVGTRVGGALTLASGSGANGDGDVTIKQGNAIRAQWIASSTDFVAFGNSPATAGHVRLRNGHGSAFGIQFRNAANSDNIFALSVDSTDAVQVGSATNSYKLSLAGVHSWHSGSATAALSFDGTALQVGAAVVAPSIGQAVDATATVTGDSFTIAAQDCSGTTDVTGGALNRRGGDATGGSGTRRGGSIYDRPGVGATSNGNWGWFVQSTDGVNFQGMQGGIYCKSAAVVPSGNPSGGGFLYVEAGALKYRGSGGTVTTVGPA